MSRHAITLRTETATDDNAIIGYDPPMRTHFIQAFEDPKTKQPALWLGMRASNNIRRCRCCSPTWMHGATGSMALPPRSWLTWM